MATYMYLRETKSTATLKEQLTYAKKKEIANEHLLGPGQYARENCIDIRQLINHPLKAGDKLIIRNLFLIGTTHKRIYDTLLDFHRNRIQLEIADIHYCDQVPTAGSPRSGNEDYSRLTAFLRVFITENNRRNQYRFKAQAQETPRKRGRPPKNWYTVPDFVREIIIHNVEHPYAYTESKAIQEIQDKGYFIGVSTYRAIKKQYKETIAPKHNRSK